MHRNRILFSVLLVTGILFAENLTGQWAIMRNDADSLVKIGTDHIYNVQFDKATECFEEVIKRYPEHPAGYFLDAMVEWWKVWLYKDTEEYDNGFLNKIERVINLCNRHLDSNAFDINYLFFKGGSLGYRGRFYAIRKSWLNAANDGKEAFEILKKCEKMAPYNHDIMLGTGIYNYFAVKFPEEYPILKPLMVFFPKGDLTIGLLQLQAASRYARYAATEAKVVLLQIYYQYENNTSKAFEIAQDLYTRYPDNAYFHRYMGKLYVMMSEMDKMEQTWREILKRYIAKKPGYEIYTAREALYYIGYALMNRGDYNKSLEYFYKCDEACRKLDREPSGFMVRLNLKIGNIYDMQGKRDLAVKQYKKVLKMNDFQDSHELAERYLDKPYNQ